MTVPTVKDDSVLEQEQEQKKAGQETVNVDDIDPDEAELIAARKALEEEEAAGGEGNGAEGDGEDDPSPDAEGADADAGETGKPETRKGQGQRSQDEPKIPKARFDEVNTKLSQAEQRLAYLEGRLEAYEAKGTDGKPAGAEGGAGDGKPTGQQQADDFQTRITAARARLNEAAKKYDAGDIGMAEYEAERGKVEDEIYEIRSEMNAAKMPRPQQPQGEAYSDHVLLERHLEETEAAHPSLQYCTDDDLEALDTMARAHFQRSGKPIGTGPGETMRLRKAVAIMADQFVPVWHPEARETLAAAAASRRQNPGGRQGQQGQRRRAPAQSQQQTRPLSPEAKARLEKLQAVQDDPPDTRNMGRSSGGKAEITEADIERMSEDEIAALPAETRARFTT